MSGDLERMDSGMDHPEQGGVSVLDPAEGRAKAVVPAQRLVPPMPDGPGVTPEDVPASPALARLGIVLPAPLWAWLCRWSGWLGPIAVAVFAGVLRFSGLGTPNALIFDETYYAKDAYSLWHGGYETSWPDDANGQITAPNPNIPFRTDPAYIVHPPVGKWIIGLGEQLYGMNPFGWRFMTAVLGTLSVLMIARIGRRLFRSTLLGCVAGLLLAVDGLHFVMSRAALLDLVVMFWFLAAFGFMLLDRDRTRALLAKRLADGMTGDWLFLGWRPHRLAAAACLGLMTATKWSGLYGLLAFALLAACWDASARRLAGSRNWLLWGLWDAFLAGLVMGVVTLGVYLSSWTGWILSSTAPGKGGYYRDWGLTHPGFGPDWLRSLWHYHVTMEEFHVNLHSPHTYQSNPWSWLLQGRPVSFFYESPKNGQAGCHVAECAREVLGIGTPLLWWAGVVALGYCLYRWLMRRDWRAGAILCGLAAGYLPWFFFQDRTIFLFYTVAFVPFVALAVAMMVGAMIGPAGASQDRRSVGGVGAGLLILAVMWNFLYFYPLYTGQTIPMEDWRARMWFTSWI
ncbi:phospholipid carrier-dependent glycosyltransferase [Kitasatospora terrestris]|uniref:Polyprenol-phosphate-mannose--protein mannosyltransferase n=2 Tax=Kitasatospora terrestris TaxID=258051 RepID=A0ABP9E029_9ACTN